MSMSSDTRSEKQKQWAAIDKVQFDQKSMDIDIWQ